MAAGSPSIWPYDPDTLISDMIDDQADEGGPQAARLKESGLPVWAVVGHWKATGQDAASTANDFDVGGIEIEAALAYYARHSKDIDSRLAANAA